MYEILGNRLVEDCYQSLNIKSWLTLSIFLEDDRLVMEPEVFELRHALLIEICWQNEPKKRLNAKEMTKYFASNE